MKLNLLHKILSLLIICLAGSLHANAQYDVYANKLVDSSADIQQGYKITDNNNANYGYITDLLAILSNSYVTVQFPQTGKAGDAVNITIQGTGQVLGAGLLNNITVRLYDSLGNNVANGNGGSLLQLSLLSNAGNVYAVRFLTNPTSHYTFRKARIEFNNILTLNVLQQFRIYNVFFQQACPPVLATTVTEYGTNGLPLLSGRVDNPANAVDNNTNNYATLTVPLAIANLLPPAYLTLSFPFVAKSGEFVGFTVGDATGVLSLGVVQHLTITAYNASGTELASYTGASLADLHLLDGYIDRYTFGFTLPVGNLRVARVKLTLGAVVGVLEDVKVFNAFHYAVDRKPVTIIASGSTNVCAGGNVTLTAIDSTGGTNYVWSTGQTSQSITVNTSGSYYVTVTDSVSCNRMSIPVQVNILPPLKPTIVGDSVLCAGSTGQLHTAAPYASYTWSNGSHAASFPINATGTYYVNVIDSNGCAGADTIRVKNSEVTVTSNITSASCSNSGNGAITTTIANGSGSYSYLWSTGATTASINNLKPGIYTAIIKDNAYNCANNYVFTVPATTTLSVKTSIVNETDSNKHDGTIALSVVGGSGNYGYSWSNGMTTASIAGLDAGLYMVTITDLGTGCNTTDTILVDVSHNDLNINTAITNINACNALNGGITATVTGGSGNYSYLWSTGATTASVSGLSAGSYYLTVTDNVTLKVRTIEAAVTNTGILNVNGAVVPAGCNSNTGSISINVSNGSGNYSYLWNTGATTAGISNLGTGLYIVTVTDNVRGCVKQQLFTVSGGGPVATLTAHDPLCATNADGSIDVAVSGNNNIFKWSDGSTGQNLANAKPGSYTVKITDTNTGCSALYAATLTAKDQVDIVANTTINNSCTPPYNGSITLTPSGGVPPYTYNWAGGGTSATAQNVNTGTYTVTVTDANGCDNMMTIFVNIDSNVLPKPVIQSIKDVACSPALNGSVDVSVSGGLAPYTYAWSNGATGTNISNVVAGTYTLEVTDNKGCKNSITATVKDRSVTLAVDSVIRANCITTNSGSVFVKTIEGFKPFSYAWSSSSTGEDLLGVSPGSYTLVVTDSIGCKDTLTATVGKTPDPEIAATVNEIKCHGDKDGSITISATAGSGTYTYSWNNGLAGASLNGLSSGSYMVTVHDQLTGCNAMDTITIADPGQLIVTANITQPSCTMQDGMLDLSTTGGTAPYAYSILGSAVNTHLNNLGVGVYSIVVTDSNNCTGNANFTLAKSADCDNNLNIHDVITPNGDGLNDQLIIEGLANYPNNLLQVFDKWGDIVYEQRNYDNTWVGQDKKGTPLPAGTYYYLLKLNAKNLSGGKNDLTGFIMIQR